MFYILAWKKRDTNIKIRIFRILLERKVGLKISSAETDYVSFTGVKKSRRSDPSRRFVDNPDTTLLCSSRRAIIRIFKVAKIMFNSSSYVGIRVEVGNIFETIFNMFSLFVYTYNYRYKL